MSAYKSILALILGLAIAGSAQAGPGKFRQWLHDKTAPVTEQAAVTATPVQAQPLTAEQQDCNRFLADIRAGRIEPTRANQAKANNCRNHVLAPAAVSTTAAPNTRATDLPPVEVQANRPVPKADFGKVAEHGMKGCGVGAVLGGLFGVDPNAACAVGGLVAGGFNYNKQLKQARAVETAARAAGGQATVQTSQVQNDKGKTAEKLDALTLTYPADAMATRSSASMELLNKIAALAKSSKEGLSFTFSGANPVCQVPIDELNKRGALAGHTVINHCGQGETAILISPVPDVR